jgi:hypothetical protein
MGMGAGGVQVERHGAGAAQRSISASLTILTTCWPGETESQHLGADGALADLGDEVLHHRQGDVGIQQRQADFAQRLGHVGLAQRPALAEPSKTCRKLVRQGVEHGCARCCPISGRRRRRRGLRVRLVLASIAMLLAKVATVYVPILYSHAVDALAGSMEANAGPSPCRRLIVGYGLLRVASAGFGELRDAMFAAVQQRTVRVVALQTFTHLHGLSLRFHLDRQTGGLSRIIERGTLGIEAVLRLAVFNVVPTMLEVHGDGRSCGAVRLALTR